MRRTLWRSEWLPIGVLLVILPLRWLLIVGLGDFPNDYVFASRLALGQHQGSDFALCYGTIIPFYPAAWWLIALSGHFLAINVNVWFWWLANALAAGWLVRKAGGTDREAAFVVGVVALLFCVPNTNLVSWHFIASWLSVISVGTAFNAYERRDARWMFVSGVACGANVMVKANVGVGTLVAVGLAIGLAEWLDRRGARSILRHEGTLGAGFMVAFAALLALLGATGGYREILVQTFVAAGPTKGGPIDWLLRAMPRISFVLSAPLKYPIEIFIASIILAICLLTFWRFWNRTLNYPVPRVNDGPQSRFTVECWALVVPALALSVWSLWPAAFPAQIIAGVRRARLITLPEFNNHLLYVVIWAFLTAFLLHQILRLRRAGFDVYRRAMPVDVRVTLLALVSLLLLMANGASGRYGTTYASALFGPFAILAWRGPREKAAARVLVVVVVYWTVAWHVAPSWHSTFGELKRLPAESIFSGMYLPEHAPSTPGSYPHFASSDVFFELQNNLPPRVKGKETLWVGDALEGAFGDVPYRFGIVPLAPGHLLRNEAKLVSDLQRREPDYIVTSDPFYWDRLEAFYPGSYPNSFFRSERFLPWLAGHYVQLWTTQHQSAGFTLWERRDVRRQTLNR